jgi:hypothetical protein
MLRKSLLAIAALTIMSGSAAAQGIPVNLWPPSGSVAAGSYLGRGVQIYVCTLVGSARQWTWKAPLATLFDSQGNRFADYSYGPTWEAPDGSKIVGTVVATAPAPRPGAILWYLASVSESSGIGVLIGMRSVQQLNTVGGLLGGPCPTPGQERRVNYTADYLFWK